MKTTILICSKVKGSSIPTILGINSASLTTSNLSSACEETASGTWETPGMRDTAGRGRGTWDVGRWRDAEGHGRGGTWDVDGSGRVPWGLF